MVPDGGRVNSRFGVGMKTQITVKASVSLDELINALAVAVVASRSGELCQWQADKLRECAGVIESRLSESETGCSSSP